MMMDYMPTHFQLSLIRCGLTGDLTHLVGVGEEAGAGLLMDLVGDHLTVGDHHGDGVLLGVGDHLGDGDLHGVDLLGEEISEDHGGLTLITLIDDL